MPVRPTKVSASISPAGPAGGDLDGTYPSPGVVRARSLQSASSDVSVFGATAPTSGQVLTATGPGSAVWANSPTGGRVFYFDPSAASDIATYKRALVSPSAAVESTLDVGATGTGDNLLAVFATEPGVPGVILLPPGTVSFHVHGKTGALNQIARLKIEVYICASDGAGEILRRSSYSESFSGTSIEHIIWDVTDAGGYSVLTTDRFVYKLYAARVSGPATCNITAYFNGATNVAYVRSTVLESAAVSTNGGLVPGVVPNLLTVSHPLLGNWWVNTPVYNGTSMVQPTGNGFGFTLFGPLAIAADPIGIRVDSVAAVNQGCGWYNLAGNETSIGHRPWMRGRVKVSATATDQAVFVGWSATGSPFGAGGALANNTVVIMADNTTHVGSYADTTWKIRSSNGSGSVSTVDTLVSYISENDYELYLSVEGGYATWAIYNRTTSTSYGEVSAIANAPSSTTGLGVVYYGMSGAAGASLRLTWGPCTRGNFGGL